MMETVIEGCDIVYRSRTGVWRAPWSLMKDYWQKKLLGKKVGNVIPGEGDTDSIQILAIEWPR